MWTLRPTPILTVTPSYFEHRYIFKRVRIAWEEVGIIVGANVNRLAYDELFLFITDSHGRELRTGQLDKGFGELEQAVFEKFPGFPRGWRGDLERMPVGSSVILWKI